MRKSQMKML